MQINKPVKFLIGLITAWYAIYPVFIFINWWLMFKDELGGTADLSPLIDPFGLMFVLFSIHCATALFQFVLMAFYWTHIIKNKSASDTTRIIFGLGIFFMPFVTMPVYFWFHVWRERPSISFA